MSSAEKKGLKAKLIAGGGTVLAVGAYIVYVIITGNFPWDAKDFTGEDLRDRGDEFRRADMVDAIFNEANISGLDMYACQLQESEMIGVIAEGTDLQQGNFLRANLQNANFMGARLVEANFNFADLTGANLRGADLRGANFDGAILDGADLRIPLKEGDGAEYVVEELFGSYCGEDGKRTMDPLSCEMDADDCCHNSWMQTQVEGILVCRNPFSVIFSTTQNDNVNIVGEYEFTERNTIVDGETLCPATAGD